MKLLLTENYEGWMDGLKRDERCAHEISIYGVLLGCIVLQWGNCLLVTFNDLAKMAWCKARTTLVSG